MSNPKFFVEGASFDDFSQGSLGNCWFVAACACLTADRKLLQQVISVQEWFMCNYKPASSTSGTTDHSLLIHVFAIQPQLAVLYRNYPFPPNQTSTVHDY